MAAVIIELQFFAKSTEFVFPNMGKQNATVTRPIALAKG